MITHIRTKGFKGFDIDEDVPLKVIYNGKNMSGKSTRAAAIALALYGNIPFSTAGKRPGDILESFGGDSLVVAEKVNGTEFARKFSRNDKGVVSQSVQIDKKKASAQNFAIMLDKCGSPKIADVAEFMRQSDAKKVDTLFELYPCPELAEIDTEIDDAKADISRINAKIDGAESTVQRLTASKNAIELPAGSISEIQSEINQIEIQIVQLEEQIKAAEISEAQEKARAEAERIEREKAERAKIAAAEQAEIEKQAAVEAERERARLEAEKPIEIEPMKTNEDWQKSGIDSMPDSPAMAELDQTITRMERQVDGLNPAISIENCTPHGKTGDYTQVNQITAANSINRIINAMTQTGCTVCAALIVAKQELKKYRG